MVEIIHDIVKATIAKVVKATNYSFISYDEITNVIYNQNWLLSLHSYFIKEWFQIPILIPFEKVIKRVNSTNLTRIFHQALLTTNGMTSESLSFKLICFKFDNMKAF
jgi:hypothetical protein